MRKLEMLAANKVHLSERECLLRGHQTVHCPLPFRKIVQMCVLLGSAAPKVDFIVTDKELDRKTKQTKKKGDEVHRGRKNIKIRS